MRKKKKFSSAKKKKKFPGLGRGRVRSIVSNYVAEWAQVTLQLIEGKNRLGENSWKILFFFFIRIFRGNPICEWNDYRRREYSFWFVVG